MQGGFVLVVGPSGAGKDTVIAGARAALEGEPRLLFPRRVVTRPASEWEAHDSLDEAGFRQAEAEGAFALSWRAHGLCYGIPAKTAAAARVGKLVLCNVSRAVVPQARERLPAVSVVEITAPPEVLEQRLARRARAEDGDVALRLRRAPVLEGSPAELRIVNDGTPEDAVAQLLAHLRDRLAAG